MVCLVGECVNGYCGERMCLVWVDVLRVIEEGVGVVLWNLGFLLGG